MLSKMQLTIVSLIIISGFSFYVTACLSQSSEQAPAPGYIQQGVKITAQKYKFTPTELTFEAGKTITIILTSVDGNHSFALDKLNVKSREAKKGESIVVELTVDAPGKYDFYCAHGNHQEKGMKGVLEITVDEKP